jgi:LPXTG-motif cell wall-anchored protein
MLDWISENYWIFTAIGVVVLGGLIGLLLFLRNRRTDD